MRVTRSIPAMWMMTYETGHLAPFALLFMIEYLFNLDIELTLYGKVSF